MAPQEASSFNITAAETVPSSVKYKQEYGNGMEQAAGDFKTLIVLLWTINTAMIFIHRFKTRDKPLGIEVGDFSWKLDYQLSDRQQEIFSNLDNIFFTVSYSILSFLMVLQYISYGKIS